MNRKHLYIVAAVIWGIPGTIISVKGISAYLTQPSDHIWWLMIITASFYTGLGPMLIVSSFRFLHSCLRHSISAR